RYRSYPSASPAAPSSVSRAMASALSSHSRSRRAGVLTWIDPIPMPKRRSLVSRRPHSMLQRLPYRLISARALASLLLVARHQACLIARSTGDGRTLGVALLAEIRREAERLALVERQIKEVETAQHAALKADTALATRACKLMRLKGLGEVFANGLTHEAFWRDFENRRQVGGAFGLTPWPWDSGDMHRNQPISKVGNRRARTLAVECAWMWTIH